MSNFSLKLMYKIIINLTKNKYATLLIYCHVKKKTQNIQ